MSKIVCIGELLIDFICKDIDSDLINGTNFIKKAGGAPANVAAAISKLGGKAYFAGKVGKDSFGYFLKKTLEDFNVDTSMLTFDNTSNTTLAFVSLKNNGERDFIFNRGADELYNFEDLDEGKLKSADIIHFGSATALLGGPLKRTYNEAIELAKREKVFVSFDPNYREDLWKDKIDEFIKSSKEFISKADLVKVSSEELAIISGISDKDDAVDYLLNLGAKMVTVTLGEKGTLVSTKTNRNIVESIKIKSIDSTGAGDAFTGAVLYKIGAYVCTKIGAMEAFDSLEMGV